MRSLIVYMELDPERYEEHDTGDLCSMIEKQLPQASNVVVWNEDDFVADVDDKAGDTAAAISEGVACCL